MHSSQEKHKIEDSASQAGRGEKGVLKTGGNRVLLLFVEEHWTTEKGFAPKQIKNACTTWCVYTLAKSSKGLVCPHVPHCPHRMCSELMFYAMMFNHRSIHL